MRSQAQRGDEPAESIWTGLCDLVYKQGASGAGRNYNTTLMLMQGWKQQAKFKDQGNNQVLVPKARFRDANR